MIELKKNSRHCHIDFIDIIVLKEITRVGGWRGGGTNDTPYMDYLEQQRRALVR